VLYVRNLNLLQHILPARETVKSGGSMDIKNKVVLITGGSEGIGKATAQLLASHGARVAVAARSIDKLRELVSNFSDGLAVEADMTQPESINRMIETVVEQYGRLIY
jgi:NAD(P)-dependent dehydrogenase (short-subunit alcohol dehydrogenase family)